MLIIFFAFLLAVPAFCLEANDDDSSAQRANEFFQRGRILFDAGDFAAAAEAFVLAYETQPHPSVLANLALSYDKAGKIVRAVETYRLYFENPTSTNKNDILKEQMARLEDQVADLMVDCAQAPCQVVVDGNALGTTPFNMVILPGDHVLKVLVDGEVVHESSITLMGREKRTVNIDAALAEADEILPSPVPVLPSPVPVVPESSRVLRAPFWVSGGVAVIGGASAAIFGGLTVKAHDRYEDSEHTNKDDKDRGESFRTVTNVLIGVSATATVAATVFAILDARKAKHEKTTPASARISGPELTVDF